jgi:hypothetical protein
MKVINSKLPVFTNMSMNPVFQILMMTDGLPGSLLHPAHLSFPIHFDKLELDFGRMNVFHAPKSNH